jgi:nicotinamidase/pyrazinamidase
MTIELNKTKTAAFDVDPQQTFTPLCPDELPVQGGHEIAGELNANATFSSIRVVSRDAHNPKAVWVATEDKPQFSVVEGHPNVDIHWKSHAMVGTKGFELIPGLDIAAYDYQVLKGVEVDKHPYGACYHDFKEQESTGVIEFLRSKDIDTVLVGGLATDYCVFNTVMQLSRANFNVVLNLASCRGIAEDTTAKAMKEMAMAGVRFVDSSKQLKKSAPTFKV